MLDVDGSLSNAPGENSCQLARLICSTVLAGELSLLSALATDELVQSHLRLNRSFIQTKYILYGKSILKEKMFE
ncbi:unnamed protein product [Adineta steineri]|uniref:hydroxymethylglutaryl-CoA reductase (NADPH) n=1 Tax=Adineta steineri TaxID=433720 RepID=A0A813QZA9_9BILA|nr:unnamed protein product [Adineta steineri]